jgi:hypothetical protein
MCQLVQKVAGNVVYSKKRTCNRIFATVRTAGSCTAADFSQLCTKLEGIWYEVVREEDYGKEGALSGAFVLRSMEASIEEGFVLPQVS